MQSIQQMFIWATVAIAVAMGTPAFARNWTDTSGKFTVEADFILLERDQVTLQRPDGQRIRLPLIRLSAEDQEYIRMLLEKAGKVKGERYALLVGVRSYAKESGLRPLGYTTNDVSVLAELLYQAGYRMENIILMTEQQGANNARFLPERAKVLEAFQSLIRDRVPGDSVLIAFAGHGIQFKGEDDNLFCPLDARIDNRTSLISMAKLYQQLESCRATTKLCFVDACRNDPFSQGARGLALIDESHQAELVPPNGVAAFLSCSEEESAYEDSSLKHGVFFHFVLEGLLGAADVDKDNSITLPEIELYVKRRVPDYVRDQFGGHRQMPNLKGNTRGLLSLVSLTDLQMPKPRAFADLRNSMTGPITVNSVGMEFPKSWSDSVDSGSPPVVRSAGV